MATLNNNAAIINLNILKRCGFYQMFAPSHKKMFGLNVYQLYFIVLTVLTQFIISIGNLGLLFDLDDTINNVDLFLVIFATSFNYLTVWKVAVLVINKTKILELLDVTDLNFLKSKQCRNNIKILYKYRNEALQLTNLFHNFCVFVIVEWMIFPIMINSFLSYKTDNQRLENVINRQYPVDVNTFNKYYFLFYVFESIIGIKTVYLVLLIDVLLLSIGWAIIFQYEVLAVSFKNIGHNENIKKGETTFFDQYLKII